MQSRAAARRADRARRLRIAVPALAFLLGAGLVGFLVWHGDADRLLPDDVVPRTALAAPRIPAGARAGAAGTPAQQSLEQVGAVETRLAMLEERFSRLNADADAAAGNAARAEALLTAASARRLIDRGEPLGYVGDQLRVHFGNAQGRAVATLAALSRDPVTLAALEARLDALATDLSDQPRENGGWSRVYDELSSLFVVRRELTPAIRPETRIERAKLLLAAGQVDAAIAEVQRLPGAAAGTDWIDDARRYGAAQQALDTLETAAMVAPRGVQDARGRPIEQPSPLASSATR